MTESYLITGGAGFIGTNLANQYRSRNKQVTVFDNFSRKGAKANVEWLKEHYGDRLQVVVGDVRDWAGALHSWLNR